MELKKCPVDETKKKVDHQEKSSYFQNSLKVVRQDYSDSLNNFPDSQLKKFPDAARESVTDLHKKKSCYLISFISEEPPGHEAARGWFFFTMAALNDDDLVDYEEEEA